MQWTITNTITTSFTYYYYSKYTTTILENYITENFISLYHFFKRLSILNPLMYIYEIFSNIQYKYVHFLHHLTLYALYIFYIYIYIYIYIYMNTIYIINKYILINDAMVDPFPPIIYM